jgi:hypothetical protein
MQMTRHNAMKRTYFLFAAFAIALLLLSLAHGDAPGHSPWLILLPVLFIGVLPQPVGLSRVGWMRVVPATDSPALPCASQRPPPSFLP